MRIENYKPGYWRVRKTIDKNTYIVTFDHKPSTKEAMQALTEKCSKEVCKEKESLKYFCEKYIDSKSNLLKSSTKRGYQIIIRNLPNWLSKKKLRDITENDMQSYVNDMAKTLSSKTIRNRYSFIITVIYKYNKYFKCDVQLPAVVKPEPYIPSEQDVSAIIKKLEGSKYEVPIKLACLGLRQSEIGALTIDDIHDGRAYISKSLTIGIDNEWVLEESNKTAASTRYVELPDQLYQLILNQGYVYNGSLHTLYDVLKRTCRELSIPPFSIHKLRHFYASYAHEKGFSEAQIMEMGGWATPNVMKTVYRHAMNKERAAKNISDSIGSLF